MKVTASHVLFQALDESCKRAGTSVDITLRKCTDGDVLAFALNAGARQEWAKGATTCASLVATDETVQEKELADLCVKLSWFPEQDEAFRFRFSILVHFDNGASVDRTFPVQSVTDDDKQQVLGLYKMHQQ